jgi:hypothetical protein
MSNLRRTRQDYSLTPSANTSRELSHGALVEHPRRYLGQRGIHIFSSQRVTSVEQELSSSCKCKRAKQPLCPRGIAPELTKTVPDPCKFKRQPEKEGPGVKMRPAG